MRISSLKNFEITPKRQMKSQGVRESKSAANPRHQEEEKKRS